MDNNQTKRNYIKRKKCLSDATNLIKQTLELIRCLRGPNYFKVDIDKMAAAHGSTIEAACWSPHSKMTAQEYQNLMMIKAQDVSIALIKQHISSAELSGTEKNHLKAIIEYLLSAQAEKPDNNEKSEQNNSPKLPIKIHKISQKETQFSYDLPPPLQSINRSLTPQPQFDEYPDSFTSPKIDSLEELSLPISYTDQSDTSLVFDQNTLLENPTPMSLSEDPFELSAPFTS